MGRKIIPSITEEFNTDISFRGSNSDTEDFEKESNQFNVYDIAVVKFTKVIDWLFYWPNLANELVKVRIKPSSYDDMIILFFILKMKVVVFAVYLIAMNKLKYSMSSGST